MLLAVVVLALPAPPRPSCCAALARQCCLTRSSTKDEEATNSRLSAFTSRRSFSDAAEADLACHHPGRDGRGREGGRE